MILYIKFFSKILFFIVLIIIEYLSIIINEPDIVKNNWDKINHLLAFFVLYLLIFFGYRFKFKFNFMILIIFAIQIEVTQYFIPKRDFSLLDILADVIGMILCYICIKIYSVSKK